MLEKIIKKDKNKELEKILDNQNIDEQAKNLLQSILYKVEVSYKDYKIVKAKKETEDQYVEKILKNIDKKCDTIKIVKLRQKLANEEIQKELEKNKYYVGEEVVSYPIEEKLLYAIERKSNNKKILNNKYGEKAIAISDFINTGKNLDRIEVLRDFSGWSWNTIKSEIVNIDANIIYQTLQILLGEEFLENWCEDKDGIIDYLEMFSEEVNKKFGAEIEEKLKELFIKIAMANTIKENPEFAQKITQRVEQLNEEIDSYEDTQEKIGKITEHKKQILKEINEIEKILKQDAKLKAEYKKRNEEAPINKKIFNIKALKQQLIDKKEQLLKEIEEANYLLNPTNYLEEKNKIINEKQHLESCCLEKEEIEKTLIEYLKIFLKAYRVLIKETKDYEEIINLIYKFRYFMLIAFNLEKDIKDVSELENEIIKTEKQLVKKAIDKKVIVNVPFEIMRHVFKTRIIVLEELYYKITSKDEKQYVQIFDENISEEKFEITPVEKTKINKKIRIFI